MRAKPEWGTEYEHYRVRNASVYFLAAAAYLVWGVYYRLSLPDSLDPLFLRLGMIGVFVGFGLATLKRAYFDLCDPRSWSLFVVSQLLLLHMYTLIGLNPESTEYEVGLYASQIAVGSVIYGRLQLGLFLFSNIVGQLVIKRWVGYDVTAQPITLLITAIALGAFISIERGWLIRDVLDSSKRLRNSLNSVQDVFVALNSQFRVTYMNDAARTWLIGDQKLDPRLLRLPKLYDLRPEFSDTYWQEAFERAFRAQERVVVSGYFEGTRQWLECHCYPTKNSLTIIATDISARVEKDRQLSEQSAKLAAASKMSTLGEMATGIAHEINNPTAVVRASAEQLLDLQSRGKLLPADVTEASERMIRMVDRVSKIIQGLRTFARDGSSDLLVRTPLTRIIDDSLELCRARFSLQGIPIETNTPEATVELECREVQLSQVLLNLLNNAYDAVENLPDPFVKLETAVTPEGELQIHVTDAGPGIPPEIAARILDPFFTTKEVGKGTGIGLSISASIMRGHGGSLTYDANHPNTRFTLTFPKTIVHFGRLAA